MRTQTVNAGVFKSYDIRGIYPEEINEELAYRIAQAYAKYVQPRGKIAVGMDVRLCSPIMHKSVIAGLTDAGVDVVDIGLASTDMYYFAVGHYKLAGGIQVTASHNPKEYGGIKMVREGNYPLFKEEGIGQIRDIIMADEEKTIVGKKGSIEKRNVMADWADFAVNFVDARAVKPLKVVMNPNFGYQGVAARYIVEHGKLPLTLIGLNDKPDGNFPKGRPDPFIPENRPEFLAKVKSENADFGVAWDADGDRVFFADDSGRFVESYYTNTLLFAEMLDKNGGGTVLYEPRYTWALIDAAKAHGGKPLMEHVGHSYIKARMKKENALMCGESSGHTYFRDFWYADSGILPFMMILEIVSKKGRSLKELVDPLMKKYFISGEINSTVSEYQRVFDEIKNKYSGAEISEFEGVSIEYTDWRANIRTSNTEPLMRLNVEGKTQKIVDQKRDELLAIIRS